MVGHEANPPLRVDSAFARAAGIVAARAIGELGASSVGLVIGDRAARILAVPVATGAVREALTAAGIAPGLACDELSLGPNALGTPVETRQGWTVHGAEHFAPELHALTCHGQPVIHPLTGRLAGVVSISGLVRSPDPFMIPFARRIATDIAEQLRADASQPRGALLDAFERAVAKSRRPVLALAPGFTCASAPALDMLSPADLAVLRAEAGESMEDRRIDPFVLASGAVIALDVSPIRGTGGALIEIWGRRRPAAVPRTVTEQWPLLLVGEPGTGKTADARTAAGADAVVLDGADIVRTGEGPWAEHLLALARETGARVIVENIQVLSDGLVAYLAGFLQPSRRFVLTSTPGDHLATTHLPLVARCGDRRDLVPLRRRRHDVPRLAERMLLDAGGKGRRFTAEALRVLASQAWPGNMAELRHVVEAAAAVRRTGDIGASDLPPEHRGTASLLSPVREAEREWIAEAINAAGGNKLRAARMLGVSRSTLYNRMRSLQIY